MPRIIFQWVSLKKMDLNITWMELKVKSGIAFLEIIMNNIEVAITILANNVDIDINCPFNCVTAITIVPDINKRY